MNKNYKKTIALLAALSMAAAAVPSLAFAEGNGIAVSDTTATVTTDKAGVAVVASYDASGRLAGAKATAAPVGTTTVEVKTGDKVMLWNGLGAEANAPIVDAVTVEAPAPTEMPTDAPTDAPTEAPTTAPDVTTAPTDDPGNVLKSWKFDMGTAEEAADGYTAVTTDMNYTLNKVGDEQYGFIGTNENDYKLAGGRIDGFNQQQGQVIELTAANGAIGSTGADNFGNAGDKYYPVRFAMKVPDDTYYRVKATVTTLDPSKPATASLYTERKHPLYTEKTIAAGESLTTEFTVRVTPIYYEKSDPKGTAKDEVVNVALLGENTALASVEIEQLESAPTLWVIGDSTVTDGGGSLPFTPYAQCTGVGTGLTKYLPKDIAMVNVGEGGLNAADNNHFNIAKSRIKAGDYMYVEYGHNHKNDGVEGYKTYLDKYYDACKEVGATLILVGPIDRHNSTQYDAETNTWSSTLSGYSNAAKEYVDAKIAAGATDIAFVDLNKPCLDWLTELTAKGTVEGTEYTNDIRFTNYYFATEKDGATDGTHPNDAGAENLAYFFFSTADMEAYPALKPLMTEYTKEAPTPVSAEVINKGWAGKSDVWPKYIVENLPELPVVVNGISFTEDGSVEKVDVNVRKAKLLMDAYGIIVVKIFDENGAEVGTLYAVDQVDNSTGEGPQTITNFRGDAKLPANGSYEVQVWKAKDEESGLIVDPDNVEYSAVLKPTDVETYIITGDEGASVEKFNYFGAENLTDAANWKAGGSAGKTLTLGTDDNGVTYTKVCSDGAKNGAAGQGSFYIMRALENLTGGTSHTGKYMISVDAKYTSGGGLNFAFAKTTTPDKSPFVSDEFKAFTIANDGNVTIEGAVDPVGQVSSLSWTNITYILDMSAGTAEISVGGSKPVTVDVPMYQTFGIPTIDTLANFIMEGQKVPFNVDITNLTVAKLKDSKATATVTVASADETMGKAVIEQPDAETPEVEGNTLAVKQGASAVVRAVPNTGYVFTGWKSGEETFSEENPITLRMYKDLDLTAEFAKQLGVEGVTDFKISSDKAMIKADEGSKATLSTVDVVDKDGNEVEYDSTADVAWSCEETGVTVENGVVTIGADFAIDANTTKAVTVKAVINGVEKTYVLTVYSYTYYEEMGDTTSFDGTFMTIGGKNSIVFPGANTTKVYALKDKIALDKATTITMDMAWSGSNTCGQLRTLKFCDSSKNVLFSMSYSWTGLQVNGTDIPNAVAKDSWTPMTIAIDPTTNNVTVTVGGASATTTLNGTELASVQFASAGSVPGPEARALGMSKIVVEQQ